MEKKFAIFNYSILKNQIFYFEKGLDSKDRWDGMQEKSLFMNVGWINQMVLGNMDVFLEYRIYLDALYRDSKYQL